MTRMAVLVPVLFAAVAGGAPPPEPSAPFALTVEPEKPKYMATVRVMNVPVGAKVDLFWDVVPEDAVEVRECDCDGTLTFAGPPRQYVVKARGYVDGKKVSLRTTVTLTGGQPDPNPNPGPNPTPDPTPASRVVRFVVVEDTAQARAWRGDVIGSPQVAAWYKTARMSHRLLSTAAAGPDGPPDAEAAAFLGRAKGKDLPWLWQLDAAGRVVRDLKVPTTPEAFVAAFAAPHRRAMGNLAPAAGNLRGTWKRFGEHPEVPLIPRAEWKPVDLGTFLPDVKDQDGVGACNAFAAVTALEAARAQAGLPYVRLSPGYLYGNINGGRDDGSLLEDGMAWLTEHGTCPSAVVGDLDWRTGRTRPPAAREQEKQYRVVEVYVCPSFDAIASAVQQGFVIVEGLMWADNFTPDRDGWLPSRASGGVGGHALCGYGLAQRNGVWGIKTRNSWGPAWGVGGNCVIPEPLFGRKIGGFWAVRSVVQSVAPRKQIVLRNPFRRSDAGRPGFTLAP